jgi:hypothetical protein
MIDQWKQLQVATLLVLTIAFIKFSSILRDKFAPNIQSIRYMDESSQLGWCGVSP